MVVATVAGIDNQRETRAGGTGHKGESHEGKEWKYLFQHISYATLKWALHTPKGPNVLQN